MEAAKIFARGGNSKKSASVPQKNAGTFSTITVAGV
jgi:hypothetical protein